MRVQAHVKMLLVSERERWSPDSVCGSHLQLVFFISVCELHTVHVKNEASQLTQLYYFLFKLRDIHSGVAQKTVCGGLLIRACA